MFIRLTILILCFGLGHTSYGQNRTMSGRVSYISSNSVYLSFTSTEGINPSDTLYKISSGKRLPALIVRSKSSISCVTQPISKTLTIRVNDEFLATLAEEKPEEEPPKISELEPEITDTLIRVTPARKSSSVDRSPIQGRASISSYNILSDPKSLNRMRYVLSLRGDELNGSRFSFDNYIVFRNIWGESAGIKDQLKVYSLFLSYQAGESTVISLGRRILPELSNLGAIDGLQIQKTFGKFTAGAIIGSRPDFNDYSIDPSLFQFGGYISLAGKSGSAVQKTTLAIIEQTNKMNTDRRFAYIQNHGTLFKNISWFGTAEISLFENINENPQSKVQLTNAYLLLRYRVSRKLSISTAYDSRKNIIYYETYRNFIDQLIDRETRQGLRLNISYRPIPLLSIHLNGGIRFQKNNTNQSNNINAVISLQRIPGINARASITTTYLLTPYIESEVAGIRIFKDLGNGKVSADVNYRMVRYSYREFDTPSHQNITGFNFALRLPAKMSLQIYYEGIFDSTGEFFHQINTRISKKF